MIGPDQTSHTETVLDEIYGRILKGDFAALPALLPIMEEEGQRLASKDTAHLKQLKEKAARNAACLEAALAGFRAARRRLAEIAAAENGLSTYDNKGGKRLLGKANGGGHRA